MTRALFARAGSAARRVALRVRRRPWLLALVLVPAIAGHVWWWYWPRLHAAAPPADSPLTGWLRARGELAETWPMAAWLPYPHQNLAMLHRRAGLDPAALAAASRLAGMPEPRLPSFGALPLPPASAMALLSDASGRRFVLAAEVYPFFALLARLAGALADNPFLGGGELVAEGRRLVVAWHGTLWTVSSPEALPPSLLDPPVDAPAGAPETAGQALLQLRIDRDLDQAPAGFYSLLFDPEAFTLTLRSAAPLPSALEREPPELSAAYLLAFAGAAQGEEVARQSLAFFAHEDLRSQDLPRVAVFAEAGARRWELPAEDLLEFSGRKALSVEQDGWQLTTFEEKSLRGGERLLPKIRAMADRQATRQLRLGLWLELGPAAAEVRRIGRMIEQVPWLAPRKAARWRDIETVLGGVADRFERLSLVVADQPPALSLRLEGKRATPPPAS